MLPGTVRNSAQPRQGFGITLRRPFLLRPLCALAAIRATTSIVFMVGVRVSLMPRLASVESPLTERSRRPCETTRDRGQESAGLVLICQTAAFPSHSFRLLAGCRTHRTAPMGEGMVSFRDERLSRLSAVFEGRSIASRRPASGIARQQTYRACTASGRDCRPLQFDLTRHLDARSRGTGLAQCRPRSGGAALDLA